MGLKPTLPDFISTATLDIVHFFFFGIILCSTVLRLVFRKWVVPRLGADDIYIVFSMAFVFAFIIVSHFERMAYENVYNVIVELPAELQTWLHSDYTLQQFAVALGLKFYDNFTQTISVTLAKLAFVSFYRRLTQIRSHRIVLRGIDVILIINCVSNCLVFLWTTDPISCYFHIDRFEGGATCDWVIDPIGAVIASCALHIFVDILLCGLPWVVLWKMQISMHDRFKLVLIYSVGLTSLACSALRLWSLDQADLTQIEVLKSDFIFVLTTTVEAYAAILCANLPILAGGFMKLSKWKPERSQVYYQHQYATDQSALTSSGRSTSLSKPKSPYFYDDVEMQHSAFKWT